LWAQHLGEADYAAATVKRYCGVVHQFLAWYEKQERRPIELADLTPIAMMGYRQTIQQNRTTATTNLHVAALRTWGNWLADQRFLVADPAERLKSVGQVKADAPVSLSDKELNALLRAARASRYGQRNYAICQLLLQTGMRLGECQALRWQDIEFNERKGSVLIRAGKGNKARSVPLNGSPRTAQVDYAARQLGCSADAKAVAKTWASLSQVQKQQPLWLSQKGKKLSASAIGRMFAALVNDCAARGLMPAATTPHLLRHSFAHRYLKQNQGDLIGLARILGHEIPETTRVYLRLTADDLAQRMEQMSINAMSESLERSCPW
jgi:site-specific recombinase XerD